MEILEAYDLTGSLRATAELTGCSHHTVARYVAARDAGKPIAEPAYRGRVHGPVHAQDRGMGRDVQGQDPRRQSPRETRRLGLYAGSERSTRRAVAQVRAAYRLGHVRVHRPWITEPGMWLQYDFGDGPVIEGRKTVLFVAWLAWSRFRIVIALQDRTAPTVFAALDRTFRILEGAPTYVLRGSALKHAPARRGPSIRKRRRPPAGRRIEAKLKSCFLISQRPSFAHTEASRMTQLISTHSGSRHSQTAGRSTST